MKPVMKYPITFGRSCPLTLLPANSCASPVRTCQPTTGITGAISIRSWRFQDRLRAERPDSLDRSRMLTGRHRPHRRLSRRDCRG